MSQQNASTMFDFIDPESDQNTLRPVTIRQVLCAEVKNYGSQIGHVSIIDGRACKKFLLLVHVISVDVRTGNNKFIFEDGTGRIRGTQWEQEIHGIPEINPDGLRGVEENVFACVVAQPDKYARSLSLKVLHIRRAQADEVAYHALHVIVASIAALRGPPPRYYANIDQTAELDQPSVDVTPSQLSSLFSAGSDRQDGQPYALQSLNSEETGTGGKHSEARELGFGTTANVAATDTVLEDDTEQEVDRGSNASGDTEPIDPVVPWDATAPSAEDWSLVNVGCASGVFKDEPLLGGMVSPRMPGAYGPPSRTTSTTAIDGFPSDMTSISGPSSMPSYPDIEPYRDPMANLTTLQRRILLKMHEMSSGARTPWLYVTDIAVQMGLSRTSADKHFEDLEKGLFRLVSQGHAAWRDAHREQIQLTSGRRAYQFSAILER